MGKFILSTINNTLSEDNAEICYRIICKPENDSTENVKQIRVDLRELAQYVDLKAAQGCVISHKNAKCDISELKSNGIIRFILIPGISLSSGNIEIAFRISNLIKRPCAQLPASATIGFQLRNLEDKIIQSYPDDYEFNTVYIDETRPIIRSFRINPSITRSSTDVILTYSCENATMCVVKDREGNLISKQEDIDQEKPFSFEVEVHLGSKGSLPQPPFYLHATNGNKKALDNTVANIVIPTNAEWEICDNFSEKILDMGNEGAEKEQLSYRFEQSFVEDLVLNESQDRIWAIMRRRHPDPKDPNGQQPCLWSSVDGMEWAPHTYTTRKLKDDSVEEVVSSVNLVISEDLVHRPCLHFGKEELLFICGSKIDMGVCTNTITAIDLKSGKIRILTAPDEMKPRSLHACLIFPDSNGNDNIWVIGGVDKNGNGLNDIWCFDGVNWKQQHSGGPAFPKRCQFAATVQIDAKGEKSIWIGGGYARFHGSALNDIWIFKGTKWEQVKNPDGDSFLSYSDEWISASSLCYLRTNKNYSESKSSSRRYILANSITGIQKQLECKWILYENIADNRYRWDIIEGIKKPELPDKFSVASNFVLTTVGFNGCVWLVAIAYISKNKISISSLYYSCPQP